MDNVLNKIIAFLSALCILIGLLIGSVFLLPASFASDSDFITNYPPIYYSSSNPGYSATIEFGVHINYIDSGGYYFSVNRDNIKFALYFNGTSYSFFFVSLSSGSFELRHLNYPDSNVWGNTVSGSWQFSDSLGVYYLGSDFNTINSSHIDTSHSLVFSSYADALNNLEYIWNYDGYSSSSGSSLYEGLNIPAGYAAWLELDNNASLDVVSSFEFNNAFLGGFNDTSQWSNIDLSATPDFSEVNRVPDSSWLLKFSPYGDKNIFGLTKNGIAHVPTVSGYNLWIVNPLTSVKYNLLNSEVLYNNSLTLVNTVGIKRVRLFAIDATVNSTGGITNTVLTQGGITVDSTTDGGFVYTDSDNNVVSAPSNGGANTYPDSSSNIFSTIERAFNDLISRLERIFNAPAIYFERIINALSNFGSWLGQLWSWLPAPLSALIEAVIYISILVGLIKLLLR